ncbi:MAG: extracellular solute-binding protein [Chloroflexi bacterium]|nr:extracellular solute-binding protein [Chloroflexota bacterium]
MHRPSWSMVGILIFLLTLTGCAPAPPSTSTAPTPQHKELILATTTSTRDSGLLDVLVPLFEQQTGYHVKVIAVGTGAALRMGEKGDADVLLVHAPPAEEAFMKAGHGIEREYVMYNDFVIVGPEEDPAHIRGMKDAVQALKKIAQAQALWISRGDDSGTHKKERALWKEAGFDPSELPAQPWYQETGQGMGATLRIASEKGAYTLTDRATYLNLHDTLTLQILVEGDPRLYNVYHVIVVNPDKNPNINVEGARAFVDFLTSPQVQDIIRSYGVDKFGQPLFHVDR